MNNKVGQNHPIKKWHPKATEQLEQRISPLPIGGGTSGFNPGNGGGKGGG